jgi:HEAT repeat protein
MSPFGPPDIEKLRETRNVKGLTKALGYQKDWPIQVAAAEALGEIGDEGAIIPLVKTALTHDAGEWRTDSTSKRDRELGCAAARALARIGPQAVAPLVEALGIIEMEASAVGGVPADAVKALKKRIHAPGADMRLKVVAHAAGALGEIRWQPAADHLARLEPALAHLVKQMEGPFGPISPQAIAYGKQLDYVSIARSNVTRALEQIWGLQMTTTRELATIRQRMRAAETQAEAQQELRKRAESVTSAADAIAVLVELYDATGGEGFVTLSVAAEPVRTVGERLNESGSFQLMQEAHSLFAEERPHLARNLEMVWDGIGTWGG